MKLSDFDYRLPEELIAQFPEKERDRSRLLVLHKKSGSVEHKRFFHLVEYLRKEDALVINDTRVFPARLFGRKETGGKAEVLLLEKLKGLHSDGKEFSEEWNCLINSSKPIRQNSKIYFGSLISAEVISRDREICRIIIRSSEDIGKVIEKIGCTPLPPYIKRKEPGTFESSDRERYQSVYAREMGAVAAPTAGLHFTKSLLAKIEEMGVAIISLTLHVGYGTFSLVRVDNIEDHEIHSEYCRMTEESARKINQVKNNGGKIYAVGTTVVRTLEYLSDEDGTVAVGEGMNDLFIYPGYRFKVVDRLITNFHLPQSTLLMLVCAFAGKENVFTAYQKAVAERYRFYSYGDAMLIM